MAKQLTVTEIYQKIKDDYNMENLIAPYKDSGTEEEPVERCTGTVLNYLINKKKFSPDIAGAGLVSVLMEIKQGKVFKGDGSYGSPGREFVRYVAMQCNKLHEQKLSLEMFQTIAGAKLEVMEEVVFEMVRVQIPWFVRIFAPGSWRWVRKLDKARKAPAK